MLKENRKQKVMSGNEAAARSAYMFTEIAPIYPITPSTDMADYCDVWSSKKQLNLFDTIPEVIEMQSEAGAAGTLHGGLLGGKLCTTFTASQGLLLMIPNMYKIVGELLPAVFHVSARTVAAHALSIFGDHSDVMACRQTGIAMLVSNSVQEAADMAIIAHLSAIKASYPFLHFFDGFRTSHEFNKISLPTAEKVKTLLDLDAVERFRKRKLDPNNPLQYGTAQNPDTYFQNRIACNKYINAIPNIVAEYMKEYGYQPFEYVGGQNAEHIIIAMGSACETIEEYIGNKNFGLIKVHLYRPFGIDYFLKTLPKTVKIITVLDRTKENGSVVEPLYLDVCAALNTDKTYSNTIILNGIYGLSSKEFTPQMVAAIFNNKTKNHFTVGINDDVTNTSLQEVVFPAVTIPTTYGGGYIFYGLGSDGTVGATKNSVQLIGDNTDMFTQAYFSYDSKKSGGTTVSHLRFSNQPIKSAYLITNPIFVACHNQTFLTKFEMIQNLSQNGIFLLNTTYSPNEINEILPDNVKEIIIKRNINLFIINAYKIANDLGLGVRINTIMQAAFFYLTNIIPYQKVKTLLKSFIDKSYGKKGEAVLQMNYNAVESAAPNVVKIDRSKLTLPKINSNLPQNCARPQMSKIEIINSMTGDTLPVSAFNADGHETTATTQFEKRNIATMLPKWIPENCIKCNRCSLVCPHASIRPNKNPYFIKVFCKDCTGCGACANVCPAKNKALVMVPFNEIVEDKREITYDNEPTKMPQPQDIVGIANTTIPINVKESQFRRPLFEFSGACAGCGETPYIKLLTQLYGERLIIANATGCSSIYGGSSPSCPYAKNTFGQGPAWANSLFEDNAEFGFGISKATDPQNIVWIIGGDGWAYDIGFGGLDHVMSTNQNVNILVLDTEVYSNTGGQASKATQTGAKARFAASGKTTAKKKLGEMMMTYPNAFVAAVAMGANPEHTLKMFKMAAEHNGPSLIIAYCTCINHGIDMSNGMKIMADAVKCGYTTLWHTENGQKIIDSAAPTENLEDFKKKQGRFK
ncbi:MAG: pyruvate:ferredoxin (flavodoxin) oxidoreductase [Christensenellaceae bacterium]|jgi:pyruvate-ferredoxin/flavodoxin oxidoreductase|nr:pyruvate:ferredoxin (flavodoxin) oxidoreductase [Christensenellaceae bacterium]